MTLILYLIFRVGKFSNWKTKLKSKGKRTNVTVGIIPTAQILVNGKPVLDHANLVLSKSGDEILIQRSDASRICDTLMDQEENTCTSCMFTEAELRSMNLKYGLNRAIFSGGECLGNLEINFSIHLLTQNDR